MNEIKVGSLIIRYPSQPNDPLFIIVSIDPITDSVVYYTDENAFAEACLSAWNAQIKRGVYYRIVA